MNHRQFMASLSKEQRQTLTAKSDRTGLFHLAQHWGAITILSGLVILKVPLWPLLMLPLGILLVFQFTLLHEAVHRTPFASYWLNILVAHICGFLLLMPAEWFRQFHLDHHRYTHNPEKDPELAAPKPTTWTAYYWHISGLPLWWSTFKTLWDNARGNFSYSYVAEQKRSHIITEARLMILTYLLLCGFSMLLGSTALLWIWLIPLVIGQPFLRLYLLAEHTGCPHSNDMFENTRTTHTNELTRWLAWNMPYHIEHHTFPAVPFFRLPELHKLTQQHLRVTANGYRNFHKAYQESLTSTAPSKSPESQMPDSSDR